MRLGAGLYFDTPNLNPFLDNRPGNGAPNGVEANPTVPGSVHTTTINSVQIQDGVDVFNSGTAPAQFSLFSVASNFVPSHNMNYNLQFEQSFTQKVVAQVGYVGSEGRHLLSILDINQERLVEVPVPSLRRRVCGLNGNPLQFHQPDRKHRNLKLQLAAGYAARFQLAWAFRAGRLYLVAQQRRSDSLSRRTCRRTAPTSRATTVRAISTIATFSPDLIT